ncbi:MAG: FMN-binding glutamate synthase family protein [Gammaproteobacteria bacterium CG_4_10_14_0_8_um_filter_38_16]|nr:MAG: FMN-binding glutamate synthase family protein [Gammaproteobacteria bacterium CG_4_10_14_0_8_um_filter_38_16]PJA02717.1 MAG: FMN-binding glutamate synthase family protein [Gammaproteobacteria bacterium CG_4_10_14_0_2_um_filter_38_22]PJB09795.1 MAG: FMN-binding glutamate synthase family protein [Gammaproteobacteria bacterium CG_4_9_14_3_um_filter_38_9]
MEHLLSIAGLTEQYIIQLLLLILIVGLVVVYIWDVTQKENSVLRNYPVIGHLRFLALRLGVYLRQYFYARDREELPFNRHQREWVYHAAHDVDTTVAFGSTRDLTPVGTVFFVDAPFPILGQDASETRPLTFGPQTRNPYTAHSILNISAMSYGALSKNAVSALSHGAKMGGCWLNTGEGGVSDFHLEGGCDLVAQIGTAKYGFRDHDGHFSEARLKELAGMPQIKMFEIKLSQGAKPGKGGMLPAIKVTPAIAKIRGIKPREDSISPNRHPEIGNSEELIHFINRVRDISQKPTGFKVVLGSYEWLDELFSLIVRRGLDCAPDFITLDGAEGGTGASPESLIDYMGLPITESLPVLIDKLIEYGLRDRIKVIASGKMITAGSVAKALCVGADFVNSARGFLFSLGCIQALRCHNNTCPTGITTHNPSRMSGLDVKTKALNVANYVRRVNYEVGVISHSCGVHEPRELKRHHARMVTSTGVSKSLAEIYGVKEK